MFLWLERGEKRGGLVWDEEDGSLEGLVNKESWGSFRSMGQFRDCDRALASKQRQNIVEHWCCDVLLVGGLDKDGSWIG